MSDETGAESVRADLHGNANAHERTAREQIFGRFYSHVQLHVALRRSAHAGTAQIRPLSGVLADLRGKFEPLFGS